MLFFHNSDMFWEILKRPEYVWSMLSSLWKVEKSKEMLLSAVFSQLLSDTGSMDETILRVFVTSYRSYCCRPAVGLRYFPCNTKHCWKATRCTMLLHSQTCLWAKESTSYVLNLYVHVFMNSKFRLLCILLDLYPLYWVLHFCSYRSCCKKRWSLWTLARQRCRQFRRS